jgi:hypothetical protein
MSRGETFSTPNAFFILKLMKMQYFRSSSASTLNDRASLEADHCQVQNPYQRQWNLIVAA